MNRRNRTKRKTWTSSESVILLDSCLCPCIPDRSFPRWWVQSVGLPGAALVRSPARSVLQRRTGNPAQAAFPDRPHHHLRLERVLQKGEIWVVRSSSKKKRKHPTDVLTRPACAPVPWSDQIGRPAALCDQTGPLQPPLWPVGGFRQVEWSGRRSVRRSFSVLAAIPFKLIGSALHRVIKPVGTRGWVAYSREEKRVLVRLLATEPSVTKAAKRFCLQVGRDPYAARLSVRSMA